KGYQKLIIRDGPVNANHSLTVIPTSPALPVRARKIPLPLPFSTVTKPLISANSRAAPQTPSAPAQAPPASAPATSDTSPPLPHPGARPLGAFRSALPRRQPEWPSLPFPRFP